MEGTARSINRLAFANACKCLVSSCSLHVLLFFSVVRRCVVICLNMSRALALHEKRKSISFVTRLTLQTHQNSTAVTPAFITITTKQSSKQAIFFCQCQRRRRYFFSFKTGSVLSHQFANCLQVRWLKKILFHLFQQRHVIFTRSHSWLLSARLAPRHFSWFSLTWTSSA